MPERGTEQSEFAGRKRPALFSVRAAGIAGLIYAVLASVSLVLIDIVLSNDPGGDLVEWFTEDVAPTATVVTLYLLPFAGIAFLWFMAGLRDSAGWRNDRLFDTVLLGSGILFVAMMFASAAALASLVSRVSDSSAFAITAQDIRITRLLAFSLFNVFAARAAGVFVMVSSTIFIRTRLLPRWIGLLGIVLALVLLLGMAVFKYLIFVFPAWAALVSIALLVRFRTDAAEEEKRPA